MSDAECNGICVMAYEIIECGSGVIYPHPDCAAHGTPEPTPGDLHIDRICKEILAGKPGRSAEVRLLAASDLAMVLDGKAGVR